MERDIIIITIRKWSLVKDHITSTLPVTLNPLQFAYRPNRSTDDALSHLDKRNTYCM